MLSPSCLTTVLANTSIRVLLNFCFQTVIIHLYPMLIHWHDNPFRLLPLSLKVADGMRSSYVPFLLRLLYSTLVLKCILIFIRRLSTLLHDICFYTRDRDTFLLSINVAQISPRLYDIPDSPLELFYFYIRNNNVQFLDPSANSYG
jgi:hypothetical protein